MDKFLSGWLRKLPKMFVQAFFAVGLVLVSLWGICATAKQIGANEAKFMYNMKPMVSLQLDSPKGFEDLASTTNPSGTTLLRVKIITEDGGFLYISPGIAKTSQKILIRAVPISRVQAIQYELDIAPIGK